MALRFSLLPLLLALPLSSCTRNSSDHKLFEAWDVDNDPNWFQNAERKFDPSHKGARLAQKPWADTSWANHRGGIARRWQVEGAFAWTDVRFTHDQLLRKNRSELMALSPAEKYDIFRGKYDYPMTQSEVDRTKSDHPSWWGMCHGKGPASLIHPEPKPIDVRSADGSLVVPFSSSDLKALLILLHAYHAGSVTTFNYLGLRCNEEVAEGTETAKRECNDMNAGALHVALTNEIGIHGRGFVADLARGDEVWNAPVYSYATEFLGYRAPTAGAAPGTVREALVTTDVTMTREMSPSPAPHAESDRLRSATYKYALELDASGNIIGGTWLSWERPDFIWRPNERNPDAYFQGEFQDLAAIVGGRVLPRPTPEPTPTVAPTAGPEPTPTVAPTAGPEPTPTVTPMPTPVVTPEPTPTVPPKNYVCGVWGSRVMTINGGVVCADEYEAHGPFNDTLIRKCQAAGGGSACKNTSWSIDFYRALRGQGICPDGAKMNPASGYCEEAPYVVGPFDRHDVEMCRSRGHSAGECNSSRWPIEWMREIR